MKNIKEWILTGLLAILVPVCGTLAYLQLTSINTSIATLSGKFDDLTKELGTDRTAVAVLNNAGDQLRDDIHQARSIAEENGRKLDTVTKDVAFVQGQISGVQEQLKLMTPPRK